MWRVIARGMKYFLCLSLLKWSWTTLCLHLWLLCTVGGETFETKTPFHQNSVAEKTMAVKLLPMQLIQQHNWLILAWSAVKLDIFPRVSNLNQKSQSLCAQGVFHQGEFLGTHHCNPDKAGLPLSHMLAANYSGHTALRTVWEKLHLMSYLWQMVSFY